MSDRSDNDADAKLLAETFHDDWASGRAADFARTAAAHARRRQRTRRAFVGASVGAALIAAVFLALRPLPPAPASQTPLAAAVVAPGYEVISDDELLAQLRDRPVLAVRRENGTREIVLLANE